MTFDIKKMRKFFLDNQKNDGYSQIKCILNQQVLDKEKQIKKKE